MSKKSKAADKLRETTIARQLAIYSGNKAGDHQRLNAMMAAEDAFRAAGGTEFEAKKILKAAEAEAMRLHFR